MHTRLIAAVVLSIALLAAVTGLKAQTAQPAETVATQPAAADSAARRDADAGVLRSHVKELYSHPMLPLWACSLALVALLIERARALRVSKVLDPQMVQKVTQLCSEQKLAEAQAIAGKSNTVVGKAWAAGFRDFLLGGVTLEESLTNASALRLKPLKRNVSAIGTISAISPLLGLLGTVVGMIMVFDTIRISLNPDKQKMAEGIMIALFTTVFGLVIAIPGIIGGRYFAARIGRFTEVIEADIDHIRSVHAHAKGQHAPAKSASAVAK